MGFWSFHPNVKLRVILNFVMNALTSMFTPFMAVYFAKSLGTTVAGVAAILSVAVGLIFTTVSGHYSDRIGRKKMMVLGETIAAAALLVMALANSPWLHSAVVTLIMTLLMSAGSGLLWPAFNAMLIDVSTPESRKSMYRITYWSNNLSYSIAGMIGAFFFSRYLFELFLVAAGMALISVIVTQSFVTETLPKRSEGTEAKTEAEGKRPLKEPNILTSYLKVFKNSTFLWFILAACLTNSVEKNLYEYMGIRLDNEMHNASWLPWLHGQVNGLEMQGYLRTENTLLVVVMSLFIGKIIRRSDGKMMLFAIFLNVIGYTYMTFGNQPSALLLSMLVTTVGELTYVPIMQALQANVIPDDSRSAYMAVGGMAYQVSVVIAGLNVILGGFIPSEGIGLIIFLTGIAAILILWSILSKLEGKRAAVTSTAGTSL